MQRAQETEVKIGPAHVVGERNVGEDLLQHMGQQRSRRLSLCVFYGVDVIVADDQVFYIHPFAPGKSLGCFGRFAVLKGNIHSRAFKFFRAVCLRFFHAVYQNSQTTGRAQHSYIRKRHACVPEFFQGQFLQVF